MRATAQSTKGDMKKVFYTDEQIKAFILEISRQIYNDEFRPNYIVGLTRGGLVPGVMLSHYLDIPFYALNKDETNCWMAEDAYGYVPAEYSALTHELKHDGSLKKNILVIDDINDTGNTFLELKKDWTGSCRPKDPRWETIWHNNVKFAALIENEGSQFATDYFGFHINKFENPEWCVFPWEQWW